MGCNCGKAAPAPAQKYVVTASNGKTYEFDDEPDARIKAVMVQGRVTVRKK